MKLLIYKKEQEIWITNLVNTTVQILNGDMYIYDFTNKFPLIKAELAEKVYEFLISDYTIMEITNEEIINYK